MLNDIWAVTIEDNSTCKRKFYGLYKSKQEALNEGYKVLGETKEHYLPDELYQIDVCKMDWDNFNMNISSAKSAPIKKYTIRVHKVNDEIILRPRYFGSIVGVTEEAIEEYYLSLKKEA